MHGDRDAHPPGKGKRGAKAKIAHWLLHFEADVIVILALMGLAVPLLSWLFSR